MSRPVCESGEVTPSKATLITLVAWPGCENLNGQVGLDWDGQKWTTDPLVTGGVTFALVPLGNDQFRIDWDLGCDSASESAGGSCDGLALLAVALVSPTCCTDPDPIGAVNMEISTGSGAPANAVPPVIPPPCHTVRPAQCCPRPGAPPGSPVGGTDPDSGDIYRGFDRFGRNKDNYWYDYNSSTDVDRIKYGYDRNGSRLYRENTVATANGQSFDELYGYDLIDRLKDMSGGDLLRLRWIMEANWLVYASGRIERVKPIAIETEGVEYFI